MAASTFLNGYDGGLQITTPPTQTAFPLPLIKWTLNRTAPSTKFETSLNPDPYPIRDTGWQDIRGTFVIERDFTQANAPFNPSGYNLNQGVTAGPLILYEQQTVRGMYNGPAHTIKSIVITSAPVELTIAGKIGLSYSWEINGSGATGTNYIPPST